MTVPQKLLVLVHTALVLAFVGYTVALIVVFVDQAQTGYISEGAKAAVGIGVATLSCAVVVAGGVALWAWSGQRRFPLVADAIVIATSWTMLLVLMFFEPTVYLAVLGLTLLCPVVAAVVPGPAGRN